MHDAQLIPELPDDWWTTAATASVLSKQFASYVVGLLLAGTIDGRYAIDLYTGFLMYHADGFFWITAGHVIDKIQVILDSTSFRRSIMRWLDGYDVPGAEAVQVHHVPPRMKSWKNQGIDIGAVKLEGLDAEGLLANPNLRVMHEQGWKNLENASPEGYYIIGYPSVWTQAAEKLAEGNKVLHSIKADFACIPLSPVQPPSDHTRAKDFWRKTDSFFAEIRSYPDDPGFEIAELAGMSGSPVLSIERTVDAQIRYRLVGVLAEWLPSEGKVRAEPIARIAEAMSAWE